MVEPPRRHAGRSSPRAERTSPREARLGRSRGLPGGIGIGIVAGAAAMGAITTIVLRTDPGVLLGAFVLAGTIVAAFAVRARSVYLIIPIPVPAYVVAAMIAGFAHQRADDSRGALAIDATQWIAAGFLAMTGAVLLTIAITVVRWPWHERRRPRVGRPVPADDTVPEFDPTHVRRRGTAPD
jgi:hypothetical protein